eukprot:11785627-Prorocentrum_lima.AAC.1
MMFVRETLGKLSHCLRTANTSCTAINCCLSSTALARSLALARWAWGESIGALSMRLRLGSPSVMSLAGVHGPGCGASPTRSPCR